MVPNGWEIGNFSSLGIKTIDGDRGKNYPKKDEYLEDGYCLFLGADNVSSNGLMLDKKTFLTREKHEQLGNGVVKYDDLLLIMRGNGTGRVCIYDRVISSYENARINSGLIIIRLNPDFLDKNFALQLMRSSFVIKQFESFMFGSAQPQLTVKILKSLKLPRPALPEQRKIAKILSTWDKAIAITEKLIETSKQQKKALMQQLLTGKKRLVNPETGKVFEGEWEVHTFEQYFDIGSSKRVLQSEWRDEGVPFYRTRELVSLAKREAFRSEIFISKELFDSLNEKYGAPKKGDLLVSGVGTLGISYLVGVGDKFYFKDGNVLWFKNLGNIDSKFFDYCFHSDFVKNQILNQATITTVGTYTITNAKKTKFKCPLDKQEQQKIASVLTAADKEIEVLQAKLAYFKQEKKALMQQLLTGKRRVKVDEEVAA
ncbi:restriction endonuclease subunit S [Vibrio sp. 10N.286.52.F8]|uniref:restriction endonuclease subunit S n=1 Tax=Vibrio sp. 10N.286.52.F8 TaxID=3229716 RepID=UPI00354B0860